MATFGLEYRRPREGGHRVALGRRALLATGDRYRARGPLGHARADASRGQPGGAATAGKPTRGVAEIDRRRRDLP